jgi:hypothetical protein
MTPFSLLFKSTIWLHRFANLLLKSERFFPASRGDTLGDTLAHVKSLTSITGSGSLLEPGAPLGISSLLLLAQLEIWFSRGRYERTERLPPSTFAALSQFVVHNSAQHDVDFCGTFLPWSPSWYLSTSASMLHPKKSILHSPFSTLSHHSARTACISLT